MFSFFPTLRARARKSFFFWGVLDQRKKKNLTRKKNVFFIFFCSVDEEEIEARTSELREKLLAQSEAGKAEALTGTGSGAGAGAVRKTFKPHEVHELAAAKIKESEKLRRALGISEEYEEGSHWRKQEEKARGPATT